MARNTNGTDTARQPENREASPNPVWFKPVMLGFMLIGLVWIVVYYVTDARFPVQALGSWNILVGFGIAFIGFMMTTRWR